MNKIAEAFELFKSNIKLFSTITLIVWLPGVLICSYFDLYVFPGLADGNGMHYLRDSLRLERIIELIIRPIYIGALFHAASQIKEGSVVNYIQSITYAARRGFKFFWACLTTDCIIIGGFIFLIIPGILLSLCFLLVEPIVVLEQANGPQARKRSIQLTKGRRWQIFGTFLLGLAIAGIVILAISYPITMITELVGLRDNFFIYTAMQLLIQIIASFADIVIFLLYWGIKNPTQETTAIKVSRYV